MNCSNNRNAAKPLRMGIMCNGLVFKEWQFQCINSILSLGFVKPVILIIDQSRCEKSSTFKKITVAITRLKLILFYIYSAIICKPCVYGDIDIRKILADTPSIYCQVHKKGKFSEYFSQNDIDTIRSYHLDFILRFGFGIIRGDIHSTARYGIWSFHHDDETKYRGAPPCFWEIYNGDTITGAVLQRLIDRLDAGIVLQKGYLRTIKHSYAKNIDQVYRHAAKWPSKVCIDIHNGVADYLDDRPSLTTAPIYRTPTNLQMLLFMTKIIKNKFMRLNALFHYDQWNVALVHEPIHKFLSGNPKSMPVWLHTPKCNHFLADPFGIEEKTGITILCEDYSYHQQKGHISSIQISNAGIFSAAQPVIQEPFHLSYPYLFTHNGTVYCVPEAQQSHEISLYRSPNFPYKWEKVTTLVAGLSVVDPTLFKYAGTWWLMCSEAGTSCNLLIWYASALSDPWQPHANNPVKTDIRSARPAGTPFIHQGALYRPAQDCSKTYGGRIVINRVKRLSSIQYMEEEVSFIEPYSDSLFPDGLHTIASAGNNATLIDGKRSIFSPSLFASTMMTLASRAWKKRTKSS